MFVLLILFQLFTQVAYSAEPQNVEWKAKFYERDLKTNTLKARGNAWFRQGNDQVWADEIEVNFTTNWAYANGNAHFFDGKNDIFCERGAYRLSGTEAVLEDATLVSGQMVISGSQIRKLSKDHFEMDDGIYSNCNTVPIKDKTARDCAFDWKVYGKHFKIIIEGYAQIYDAIIYTKDLPIAYVPYYVSPAKSTRQTGFLWMDMITGTRKVGSGFGIPFFWAISSWHDLTISPTYYSKAGTHLGLNYNYAYSPGKSGIFNFYGSQLKYSPNRYDVHDGNKKTTVLGEWGMDVHNSYTLGKRAISRQSLTYVSDPYFPIDYPRDFGALADKSALRSQISFTNPTDNYLATANIAHFQNLVMPTDSGQVDKGPVTQLPALAFYRKNSHTPLSFISYEIDTRFTNYYRTAQGFDIVPDSRTSPIPNRSAFGGNDYVREGRRLQLEPRLVTTVPLASGFQLQPTLKAGSLFYHFDVPSSEFHSQEYVDLEVPFTMYLARNYGESKSSIRHVFQPRLVYASALYRKDTPDHPFFRRFPLSQPETFSNPRFDILDQVTNFEYMRVELANRFLRWVGNSRERFLLVQVANQLNSRKSDFDPRFRSSVGPMELLIDFSMSPVSFQVQGSYQIEKKGNTHESDWTGTFTYSSPEGDSLSINGLYRIRDEKQNNQHRYTLSGSKKLPLFVDIGGSAEYNAVTGKLVTYSLGLTFAAKPVSCWSLNVSYSRAITGETATNFLFGLNFGGAMTMTSKAAGV